MWVERVSQIAAIHDASDNVTLLAAPSKYVKDVLRWYEIQTGAVLESWESLRRNLVTMFDRRIPFYIAMQQVEVRKWFHSKETFDQYVIDKMAYKWRQIGDTIESMNDAPVKSVGRERDSLIGA